MAKKITGYVKLQIPAGKATPAPPVGPALGQHGLNIVQFTKEFNARTAQMGDVIIPVVITVYADRTYSFITKVAKISRADVQKIAEQKMPDLNAGSIEAATSMIAGTARSMGIVVED